MQICSLSFQSNRTVALVINKHKLCASIEIMHCNIKATEYREHVSSYTHTHAHAGIQHSLARTEHGAPNMKLQGRAACVWTRETTSPSPCYRFHWNKLRWSFKCIEIGASIFRRTSSLCRMKMASRSQCKSGSICPIFDDAHIKMRADIDQYITIHYTSYWMAIIAILMYCIDVINMTGTIRMEKLQEWWKRNLNQIEQYASMVWDMGSNAMCSVVQFRPVIFPTWNVAAKHWHFVYGKRELFRWHAGETASMVEETEWKTQKKLILLL